MAKQNSSLLKLLIGAVAIDNLTKLSFKVGNKLIDVTSKDSAGWEEFLAGLKNASISGGGIVDYQDSGVTPNEIYTALVAGTVGAFELTDAVTGDYKYTGSALYEELTIEGDFEGAISFSFTMKVTGVPTQAVIS